jgi:AcrR family transcriptional regulator
MVDKKIFAASRPLTTRPFSRMRVTAGRVSCRDARQREVEVTNADRVLPAPKQARSEVSTGKLLDAAAELISEGGYERMTMAAIGKRAGYSHGLVTARFGSKEGLLWALVDRMVNDWRTEQLLPTTRNQPSVQALHTMLDELGKSWRRSPARMRALYILMFEALLPVPLLHERMAELHEDLRRSVTDTITRSIADRSVSADVDAEAVARLIVGALRGAVYQAMLDPERVSIKTALADVRLLVDFMLPPPLGSPRR